MAGHRDQEPPASDDPAVPGSAAAPAQGAGGHGHPAPGFIGDAQSVQVQATVGFSPASLLIGTGATQNLTLNLSSPAPAGGIVVNLSSSNPAIRDQGEGTGAAWLACCTVLTSFVLAAAVVYRVMQFPGGHSGLRFTQPYLGFEWIEAGSFRVQANLLIDNLSSVMVLVVTGVGSLIHVYSVGYMAHDEDKVRYFSYLNLFTFFMLLLVLGGSLPLMFVGWEGVGLCSYLLIGFWFQK